MLNLTRWTPWTELAGLHRDLDSTFGRVFGEARQPSSSLASFTPAADVSRRGDKWIVSIAVPRISPEKVDINIAGRVLRVRGERPWEGDTPSVISEIPYGPFEREFTLPDHIDTQHVEATYSRGMLELVLPLKESAKPHRIEVKVAPEAKQLHVA